LPFLAVPSTMRKRTRESLPAAALAAAQPADDVVSRAQFAYDALLRGMAEGTFQPGDRMRELAVCDWLQISRTPVREALRRLEADGLLSHAPRGGLVVTPVDRGMVGELYDMREVLEGTAARLAAARATRADLDELHDLVAREARLPPDPGAAAAHNRAFHLAVYEAAHNRYLLKSVRAIADAILLLGPTTMHAPRRQKSAHAEHRALVDAIASGRAGVAESLARRHIRSAYEERVRMLFGATGAGRGRKRSGAASR
jgi:DNA-binding GntR family transcriptional regulator